MERERGDIDPGRPPGQRALLIERPAFSAIDEPLEDLRSARYAAQRTLGDGEVVLHQRELGDAGLREVDLRRVRHGDLVTASTRISCGAFATLRNPCTISPKTPWFVA